MITEAYEDRIIEEVNASSIKSQELKDDLIEVMMKKFAAADGMNAFLDRVLGG